MSNEIELADVKVKAFDMIQQLTEERDAAIVTMNKLQTVINEVVSRAGLVGSPTVLELYERVTALVEIGISKEDKQMKLTPELKKVKK